MKRDKLCLIHMKEALKRIESYVGGGQAQFTASTLVQDAVLWNLQYISESVKLLSDHAKTTHPELDWQHLSKIRHVHVHTTLGPDPSELWQIVANELPGLQKKVRGVLATIV